MHRLLPLGILLVFAASWVGFVPVSTGGFECGSLYSPKSLSTDFPDDFPIEVLGQAQDAFGSVNEACSEQRTRMLVLPMAGIVVAGIAAGVAGGLAWRRRLGAARAATAE
ncbi:hypothetical protein [Actinomadura violacea]|uniref:Uncharacterized protein n=1 Tax=Actinomadura violacea TaxID=2819934 RepID=A0ABS3RWL0_9ACTN|nr:hypothetical protein [Actinomadura violacea]MBO2461149.1 hypothetical protein [Actinomadura violacea]